MLHDYMDLKNLTSLFCLIRSETKTNYYRLNWTRFPILSVSFIYLLWVLIGSLDWGLDWLCPLWLADWVIRCCGSGFMALKNYWKPFYKTKYYSIRICITRLSHHIKHTLMACSNLFSFQLDNAGKEFPPIEGIVQPVLTATSLLDTFSFF